MDIFKDNRPLVARRKPRPRTRITRSKDLAEAIQRPPDTRLLEKQGDKKENYSFPSEFLVGMI